MAKIAIESNTKLATKSVNDKTRTKATKPKKPEKSKHEPSAYNLFIKAHLKPWLEANPNKKAQEGMVIMGTLWKDAPENPNRGNEPKPHKPKAPKELKTKVATKAKPKLKKAEAEEEDKGEEGDDEKSCLR